MLNLFDSPNGIRAIVVSLIVELVVEEVGFEQGEKIVVCCSDQGGQYKQYNQFYGKVDNMY
jgi:hypothetical protein